VSKAAKKDPNAKLVRLAKPIKFDTYTEANEHRAKILEHGTLLGKEVVKCKVARRGNLRSDAYFDVIPYGKAPTVAAKEAAVK
jgi:hypothetical protein